MNTERQLEEANRFINTIRNRIYNQVRNQVAERVFYMVYNQLQDQTEFEVLDNYIQLYSYLTFER